MSPRKKKIQHNVLIEGMSSEGRGIAKIDGKVTFVDKTTTGDIADIQIYRKRKNYQEAYVLNFIKTSDERVEPFCTHFGLCGGCKWQYLPYKKQLEYKQDTVHQAFTRIAKTPILNTYPIIGSNETVYYRNKLEFTFSNKRWLTQNEIDEKLTTLNRNGLGFHIPKQFSKIVDIKHCFLQAAPSNAIRMAVKAYADKHQLTFFDLIAQKGLLRNLIIKTSTLGQVLVLVSFYQEDPKAYGLLQHIADTFPQITSLQYVINFKKNDTLFDLPIQTYKGKDHIIEKLGDRQFKIGAKSFFQTNPKQAENLYAVIKKFAQLKSTDLVYDLYTGVGSIALYLATYCRSIIGVEQVEEAILDAKYNAKLNKIENALFYASDVKTLFDQTFIQKHGKPDVLITDPPRAGMHPHVIETIRMVAPAKVVYVSCNPASQARDIGLLGEKYQLKSMQAVDMFPHTTHIENVALLELK